MGADGSGEGAGGWQEVELLLDRALDAPVAQRAAFLERSGASEQVISEVRELLRSSEHADGFLEEPISSSAAELVGDLDAAVEVDALLSPPGSRTLGSYRLLRRIAGGGMGVVYLAERADGGSNKPVAIKLMKGGFSDDERRRRFLNERQVLADLDHPHIARLLDGGLTPSGDPYMVMEYIEGEAIDHFCASQELDLRSRLKLFKPVCEAVHAAHERGVIHRDLKPANILVNREGDPKLVDFGIAKLDASAWATDETVTGLLLLTPNYTSPEQIRGEKILPAADIFVLGVVLFELVTGRRLYNTRGKGPLEMERLVCREPASKPSVSLRSAARLESRGHRAENGERTPRARRTAPPLWPPTEQAAAWSRELELGVDEIVLTALEKDPRGRFASAGAMGEAIQTYLEAGPEGPGSGTGSGGWLKSLIRRMASGS